MAVRTRTKPCARCEALDDVLYRCRYDGRTDWVFLCKACLLSVKGRFPDTYQYGGTWKRNKR